jgi:hypothetical protein
MGGINDVAGRPLVLAVALSVLTASVDADGHRVDEPM